jgi:hypothetical protein
MLFGISGQVMADITSVTLAVNSSGGASKINGSGQVTLNANWTGDTPPYSAAFKLTGGGTLGTETTSGNSASLVVSGAVLGHGSKSFEVSVIETSVPGATAGSIGGDKAVEVDLESPVLTASVVNGPIFANTQTVRVQITCSNEVIQAPTVTCNGKTFDQEGSLTEGAAFTYTLQLDSSFTNGQYTVNITAKDTSQPAGSANTGTTTTSFTVGTSATGATEITSSSPASPTNATSVTLSGSCPNGATTIELLDGGAAAATVSVTGTSWSIGISPAEGTRSYVAVSKDVNGTEISRSSTFTLVVDRTPPAKPVADASGLPATTNQSSISVPVEITGVDGEVAKPVTIQPIVNGVDAGTAQNVGASPVNVTVPLQDGLNNITFRVRDAAGNTADISDVISITRDASTTSGSTIVTLDAPVVMPFPIADNYKLGAGTYSAKMIFDKQMDGSVRPQIDITTAGGSNISSTTGSWVASNTYIGQFTIPPNGGDAYDGNATMVISNAKDVFGNTLDSINVPSSGGAAFSVDSTPPVSAFNDEDSIYVPQDGTPITITGTVTDDSGATPGSGIEYVELVWQEFNGSGFATQSVPLQATSPSPWSINWDASALNPGRYKLWVRGVDRAKPNGNVEAYSTKAYRIVIVDRDVPSVTRISLDDMVTDIAQMNGGAPPVVASAVTKLTAVINDGGNSGIAFSSPSFEFSLTHDETGNQILGNYTNNASDTIFFTFPQLTENGTYTVKVVPVDNSGNVGASETRQIILDTEAPSDVTFDPANHSIANETHVALELDQIWAVINDPMADHTRSTMEVRYNGNIIGEQVPNVATATVWDIGGPTQTLPKDQSGDGRYDITVMPRDIYGNIGSAVRSYFNYDCVPPVITSFTPAVSLKVASPTWFGLSQSEISVSVSDAPKDIITYKGNMDNGLPAMGFDFNTVQIPGDPNWYNGQGSGVNTTTSSFTITVDGVESGPATVAGLKFSQPRPNVPADTSAGVLDVRVSMNIQDNVNNGQTIPNASMASYTLKFDYLNPSLPKITKPTASNNKYCKNTVTIEGSAKDEGTSNELMIKRIEWSENGSAFTAFSIGSLPKNNASFTAGFDITSRSDGTYTLDIRAVDLGENVSSSAQTTFVVDRTPPKPPEMVVPLPDAHTNKRGQMFKWATSTDADRYLLQVADDSSFNNILNKQTNPGYTDLIGQVTVMTENSVSVPKDGTYYWRVAAIETCVDGYNISSFSATRRFTVDTVRPTVVEVQPAPSSANKISTGMVTFTIRFSELVDTTVPPSVRMTSNGGQVMNIELKTYTEDTWIGTTVVPKNNSALYDGNAIITIESAADLAGNIMAVDSTHSVVINTGPAFSTKIFSNPANELEIMVITKSSEALQAPPTCTIEQNSVRTPVIMNFLKERYYAGAYKIDINSPGKAYIDMSGTDLHGMTGYDSLEFTVAELNQDTRLNITSASGKASLKAAENSAYTPSVIYLLDRDNLDSPFTNEVRASVLPSTVVQSSNGNELVPVMALDEVGPASLKLKKCLLYTAEVKSLKTAIASEKIGLYRLGKDGKWIYQGGELKGDEVSAQLTGMGRLALMADMTAPSLREQKPQNMEELEDALPEISGKVVDNGSGFKKDSFKLFIDDLEADSVTVNADGTFKYKPRLPMKKGKHEIRIEATDLSGNELRNSFWVTTLGNFAIGEFMPYPNPVTGNSMYFNYDFNQTAERVVLRIYDVAGHKVAQHDTFDFASAQRGRFRWDLRNDNGKIVANGVYFYKLEITKNGQTFKKRGKFAVMR